MTRRGGEKNVSFVNRVAGFFKSVELHRAAALVASVALALQGVANGPATSGFNPADVQIAIGVLGGVATVARELTNASFVPFVTSLFKPTPPAAK